MRAASGPNGWGPRHAGEALDTMEVIKVPAARRCLCHAMAFIFRGCAADLCRTTAAVGREGERRLYTEASSKGRASIVAKVVTGVVAEHNVDPVRRNAAARPGGGERRGSRAGRVKARKATSTAHDHARDTAGRATAYPSFSLRCSQSLAEWLALTSAPSPPSDVTRTMAVARGSPTLMSRGRGAAFAWVWYTVVSTGRAAYRQATGRRRRSCRLQTSP